MLLEGAGLAHPFIALEPGPVPGPCREPLAEPVGAQADPIQAELELWLQSCSFWVWFQQCPILIFISRINLWSYFPFPPLPFLSYPLYSKNLIISPRSSAPLTFPPNACELCCIPKCCSCSPGTQPGSGETWTSASPSNILGWESPCIPQIHTWNPKSTPGTPQIHSTAKEDGILNSSFALLEPGLLQQIKAKGLWEEHPRQRNGQELQGLVV